MALQWTSHVKMTWWHKFSGGRECDYLYVLLTGSSRRNWAPRSTGKSRGAGTASIQNAFLVAMSLNPPITNTEFFGTHTTSTHHDSYINTSLYAHMHTHELMNMQSHNSKPFNLFLLWWHLTWLKLCSGPGVAGPPGSHWSARREGR